jgi:O-antigen/teichoic acid export membrane protein
MLVYIGVTPLWPAYAEALASGDMRWVRRALRNSVLMATGPTALGALVLVATAPSLLDALSHGHVHPSLGLMAAFGAWALVQATALPYTMLLNGAGLVRFQATFAVVTAALNVFLAVMFSRLIGLAGIAVGAATAQVLGALIPLMLRTRRVLARRA